MNFSHCRPIVLTAIATLAMMAVARAASTEESLISTSQSIANALGKKFDAQSAKVASHRAPTGTKWSVTLPDSVYFYDGDGTFRGYSDFAASAQVARRNPLAKIEEATIKTESDALTRGRAVLDKLGLRFESARVRKGRDGSLWQRSGQVAIGFEERPGGYETNGSGNHASVLIDSTDGSLLTVAVARGWRYGPTDGLLTADKASSIAIEIDKANDAKLGLLRFVQPLRGSSPQSDIFLARKEARLAYVYSSEAGETWIDAVTGATLGFLKPAKQENVRPATASDIACLTELLKKTGLPYTAWKFFVEPRGADRQWVYIQGRKPNGKIWNIADAEIFHGKVAMFAVYQAISAKTPVPLKNDKAAIKRFLAVVGPVKKGERLAVEFGPDSKRRLSDLGGQLSKLPFALVTHWRGSKMLHHSVFLRVDGQLVTYVAP